MVIVKCRGVVAALCASGLLAAGCTAEPSPVSPSPTSPDAPVPPRIRPLAAERVVVLDPGHNGGNAADPAAINRPVPNGRGGTKACNTTGTAAHSGYAEHEFTWDIAIRVRDTLTARGIRVVLTRPDDHGVGPCVDERAAIGNRNAAAAVVSIHADGAATPGAHGFHVAYSAPPLNPAQGEPSLRLATTLRDVLAGSGFATATYIGSAGLDPRADLAGLNLSERPAALVECGNMRDAGDAALLESADGRGRIAAAIADAIAGYAG